MKKILRLSLVFSVLTLIFAGCSRDEATPTIQEKLTGTWLRTALTVAGQNINNPCYMKGSMIFTDTQLTFVVYENLSGNCVNTQRETGTYTVDNEKITYKKPNGDTDIYFYKLEGDILVISWISKTSGQLYVGTLKRQK